MGSPEDRAAWAFPDNWGPRLGRLGVDVGPAPVGTLRIDVEVEP